MGFGLWSWTGKKYKLSDFPMIFSHHGIQGDKLPFGCLAEISHWTILSVSVGSVLGS